MTHKLISDQLRRAFDTTEVWASVVPMPSDEKGEDSLCFFPVDNTLAHSDPTIFKVLQTLSSYPMGNEMCLLIFVCHASACFLTDVTAASACFHC